MLEGLVVLEFLLEGSDAVDEDVVWVSGVRGMNGRRERFLGLGEGSRRQVGNRLGVLWLGLVL